MSKICGITTITNCDLFYCKTNLNNGMNKLLMDY